MVRRSQPGSALGSAKARSSSARSAASRRCVRSPATRATSGARATSSISASRLHVVVGGRGDDADSGAGDVEPPPGGTTNALRASGQDRLQVGLVGPELAEPSTGGAEAELVRLDQELLAVAVADRARAVAVGDLGADVVGRHEPKEREQV